jgi:hypothetical protein
MARRALEMLAGSPHGCTESIMMAHGCAIGVLRDLQAERAPPLRANHRSRPGVGSKASADATNHSSRNQR